MDGCVIYLYYLAVAKPAKIVSEHRLWLDLAWGVGGDARVAWMAPYERPIHKFPPSLLTLQSAREVVCATEKLAPR